MSALVERSAAEHGWPSLSITPWRVTVGHDVYEPRDFERSFLSRGDDRAHFMAHRLGDHLCVLSWERGLGGVDIALARADTVFFRYVRTGPAQGWFDVDGVAAWRQRGRDSL